MSAATPGRAVSPAQPGWKRFIELFLAARPGAGERDTALAAKVGDAYVQAAIERWLVAPRTDLAHDIDHAFGELATLAEGVVRA